MAMEYEGMMLEVVARGIIGGKRGSMITSGTGAGAGEAFFGRGFFFFLGFLLMAEATMAAQQQHTKAAKNAHCHNCMKEPQEPDALDPELSLEPIESPEESFLKELEYEDSKDFISWLDDSDESHGVFVVVTVVAACA